MNKNLSFIKQNYQAVIILLIGITLFLKLVAVPFVEEKNTIVMAKNFLKGRVYFQEPLEIPPADIAIYQGKYYQYTGPFPSVLAIPLVYLFGNSFSQRLITFGFVIIAFTAIYKIARKFLLTRNDAVLITAFFIFGSVYLYTSVVNITTLQVQTIATSLLLLSLYEYFHKRNWVFIGIILSCAFATRLTTVFSVIFFIMMICLERQPQTEKIRSLMKLFLPILITFILLFTYNFVRFGNGFESGYKYNISFSATPNHQAAEKYGLFSLHHIPVNLYFFLFKGPEIDLSNLYDLNLEPPYLKANGLGMGILFTSPLFIYLLFLKLKNKFNIAAILTSVLLFLPSLTYFGIGNSQFGYRYALDFYPFLLILLLSVFQKIGLPKVAKLLIAYSIFFDAYFLYSIWGIYPFR